MDLDSLSLVELKALRTKVERAIDGFEDRKKKEALLKLEEAAKTMGFSLAELTGVSATKARKPVAPKYANPADAAQTWTGRGRKPHWVVAELASGKSLEDLAI